MSKAVNKRYGYVMTQSPIPRTGNVVMDCTNTTLLGSVTSGCFSPTRNQNIALVRLNTNTLAPTRAIFNIRGKLYDAQKVKLPFVPLKFFRKKTE